MNKFKPFVHTKSKCRKLFEQSPLHVDKHSLYKYNIGGDGGLAHESTALRQRKGCSSPGYHDLDGNSGPELDLKAHDGTTTLSQPRMSRTTCSDATMAMHTRAHRLGGLAEC